MTRVTNILNTKYPLIQAPMSWVTNATLVAAVSESGGLGVLGPNAGQTELTNDPIETAERMRIEIQKVKTTTNKSFGINILLAKSDEENDKNPFLKSLLQVAFDEGVNYFVIVGEANQTAFNTIKEHDGIIIFRPLTPTVKEMQRAEAMGADILVATGRDEGGVLPEQEYGTFTVVPAMVDAVSIPVLAAGGINDSRGVDAAIALGAEGVYIGTRFLVTKESPMAKNSKQLVINSSYQDLVAVSYTQKSLKTPAALKLAKEYQQHLDNNEMNKKISEQGGLRPGMLAGLHSDGIISVNTGIDVIKNEPTVKELIEELMRDFLE